MKKLILSVALIAATTMSFAQIGIGTTTPEASAVLDLTSTTQGLLPPRLTQAQMNLVTSPVEGLMVYCSVTVLPKGSMYYRNCLGTISRRICSSARGSFF